MRLTKFLDPDAKNMDERMLAEHAAFAALADTWMDATNTLTALQAGSAQAEAASKVIIETPYGRAN